MENRTMNDAEIRNTLKQYRRIAVVGLSDNPDRPSYGVTKYMIQNGYDITGVRPAGPEKILHRPCFKSLKDVPGPLEIVNVFRASEHIPALVEELIPFKPKVLWLQLGISHPQAEARAQAAGIQVISNRCIMIEHHKFF